MLEESKEIWKEIDGFKGEYWVSSHGRVKNINTGRLLGGGHNSNGYPKVTIKHKNYSVHRLVALAFIPNPNDLPQINHLDENKKNNHVSNLAWCSASENVSYSIHHQSCKVKQLDKDGNLIRVWDSIHQINRELGYARQPITKVCKGRQIDAYGYIWRYVNPESQRVMNRPVIVHKGDEYIGTFASATKASEALGLKYCSVNCVLQGRHATLYGYRFEYAD